jgi:Tfp pilus assembly protein PilW
MTTLRSQHGYTVAELLVVTATLAFVMAGLFTLLSSGQQTYIVGSNRAEAQQSARLVLNTMVQELRTSGFDPLATGTFPAVTALANGTGFVIKNDWNASGAIETGITVPINGVNRGEQITYTFNGTSLTRQESTVDAAAVTLTTAINSVSLQYLDADDVAVPTPSGPNASLIRTVVIDLTTNPDTTFSDSAHRVAVRTVNRVRIRSR